MQSRSTNIHLKKYLNVLQGESRLVGVRSVKIMAGAQLKRTISSKGLVNFTLNGYLKHKRNTFLHSTGSLYLVTELSPITEVGISASVHLLIGCSLQKHLSFRDKLKQQTFFRFLLPAIKHSRVLKASQEPRPSNESCCDRLSGLLVSDGPPLYANPHDKRQTDVSHMCFHFHLFCLFLLSSASLFQTTITGVACSIITSPVKPPEFPRFSPSVWCEPEQRPPTPHHEIILHRMSHSPKIQPAEIL